jgi:hypothetical protein
MTQDEENENLHKADQVYFLYDPQPVRLLDVIYVGPVMIYAGLKAKNINQFVKWSLIGVGICTVLYNGANFFINEKKAYERRKRKEAEQANTIEQDYSELVEDTMEQQLTQTVLQNNMPIQVDVDENDFNDINNIALPTDIAEALEVNQETTTSKKGRGRPSKSSEEIINHIQDNGHSIQRS